MANVLTYLDWRGDLSFGMDPPNMIDMLVFSVLSYTNMDGLAEEQPVKMKELFERYDEAGYDQSKVEYDPKPLLEKAAQSKRFQDILVCNYINHIDHEQNTQFSAVTFQIDEKTSCVAFRGTDPTLTGWHEDMYFSCMEKTPAQQEAEEYLNECCAKRIYVTGHSKGGNLAIYAGTFCNHQDRIKEVVSFDGPGFQPEVLCTEAYRDILWKVRRIAPADSLIGQLMHNDARQMFIQSDEKYLLQHDPYSWQLIGKQFEEAEQSSFSLLMKEVIDTWLDDISMKERKRFVDTVFQVIEASGYKNIKEINEHRFETFLAIIKALVKTDRKQIKKVSDIIGRFAANSSDVLWNEIRKNLSQVI